MFQFLLCLLNHSSGVQWYITGFWWVFKMCLFLSPKLYRKNVWVILDINFRGKFFCFFARGKKLSRCADMLGNRHNLKFLEFQCFYITRPVQTELFLWKLFICKIRTTFLGIFWFHWETLRSVQSGSLRTLIFCTEVWARWIWYI